MVEKSEGRKPPRSSSPAGVAVCKPITEERAVAASTTPITEGERAFWETVKRRHSDPTKFAKIRARLEDDRRNPAYF